MLVCIFASNLGRKTEGQTDRQEQREREQEKDIFLSIGRETWERRSKTGWGLERRKRTRRIVHETRRPGAAS